MSLKNKLNRLKPHLSNDREEQGVTSCKNSSVPVDIPFLDIWKKENSLPYYVEGNYCLVREVVYPLDYKHGIYSFREFIHVVNEWNKSSLNHPLSSKGHSPDDLFFFDTETTGLGGGTGNTIFLLGHARLYGKDIILKQHILPHPGAEVPLYKSFLEEVNYSKLVTYNGKAFDWPQVKTRHTLIREHVPKLPSFGHFDLYHASRRMWKHKLNRLKLSVVESEVLQIERKDDIPGFLAPMIYFDFVKTKDPQGMLGILKHNEIDILSLITLYTHLSFQLLQIDKNQSVKETLEVGKWFSKLGESTAAEKVLSSIMIDFEARHLLAFEYKKKKEWSKAKKLWLDVASNGNNRIRKEACIELAKIYEHKEKNINKALYYSEIALDLYLAKQKLLNLPDHKELEDIRKRLKRLQYKNQK